MVGYGVVVPELTQEFPFQYQPDGQSVEEVVLQEFVA